MVWRSPRSGDSGRRFLSSAIMRGPLFDSRRLWSCRRFLCLLMMPLSRQPLPTLDRNKYAAASGLARGAYVLADAPGGNPDVILIASGSEVSLAVDAHEALLAAGIRSRVVSMPSWDIFDLQTQEYRDSVLSPKLKARVAVEQASTFGWERYVGTSGRVLWRK